MARIKTDQSTASGRESRRLGHLGTNRRQSELQGLAWAVLPALKVQYDIAVSGMYL